MATRVSESFGTPSRTRLLKDGQSKLAGKRSPLGKRRHFLRFLIVPATAGFLLAGCGQAGSAAIKTVVTYTSIATVDSGAECVPDLNTTHISLVPPVRGTAGGVVPSDANAQQVRGGAVPAPPNGQIISQGAIVPQTTGAAGSTESSALDRSAVYLYETSCGPGDVQAFYVAALLQNQWSGSFVPASGTAPHRTSATSTHGGAVAGGAAVTLFDLAALTTGRFVNVHPSGDAVAFIEVLAAIVAPGSPQERHPTYVQIIIQPRPSTAGTPPLPPSAATTPNVGASAAPPAPNTAP